MKRDMDDIGLLICDMQGDIFEASISQTQCSSNIFIRRFMNSKFVQRMDDLWYLYESSTIENVFDELDQEYGKSNYGKIKFSIDELYWIGYIYRYLCYVYMIDSKRAYKIIKGSELRNLYHAYHTLDPMNAIDRILEQKSIKLNKSHEEMIQEGVIALRRIRAQEKNKKE